jgi:hypothetical protein
MVVWVIVAVVLPLLPKDAVVVPLKSWAVQPLQNVKLSVIGWLSLLVIGFFGVVRVAVEGSGDTVTVTFCDVGVAPFAETVNRYVVVLEMLAQVTATPEVMAVPHGLVATTVIVAVALGGPKLGVN